MLAKLLEFSSSSFSKLSIVYIANIFGFIPGRLALAGSTSDHPKYEASTIVMFTKQRKMFCGELTDDENFLLRYRLQLKLGPCVPLSFLQLRRHLCSS